MAPLDPRSWPLALNLALFGASAIAVWLAGSRLSRLADVLAERTKLGRALVGLLLLAVAASLPEIATGVTAAWLGNAELATGDILGDFSMMIAFLAVADATRATPLTRFAPQPVLLLEGVLLVFLMTVVALGIALGEPSPAARIGLWPLLLFALYLVALFLAKEYRGREG